LDTPVRLDTTEINMLYTRVVIGIILRVGEISPKNPPAGRRRHEKLLVPGDIR